MVVEEQEEEEEEEEEEEGSDLFREDISSSGKGNDNGRLQDNNLASLQLLNYYRDLSVL